MSNKLYPFGILSHLKRQTISDLVCNVCRQSKNASTAYYFFQKILHTSCFSNVCRQSKKHGVYNAPDPFLIIPRKGLGFVCNVCKAPNFSYTVFTLRWF